VLLVAPSSTRGSWFTQVVDNGTPEDAIAAALIAGRDTEEGWIRVVELQRRGDDATLQAAARLLETADADRRVLAADILGQLGAGDARWGCMRARTN
jgi:hypothetical protein